MRPWGQAFGTFDNGHLEKADELPLEGDGYLKVFQERDRGFGSLDLISLIQASSKEIRRDFPAVELVQVGDLAKEKGGNIPGHGSHQNGLDVDIVYFRKDRYVMPKTKSCPGISTGFCEQHVDPKGRVKANFDVEANWRMIQLLDSSNRLDRIFTDLRLKKVFCEYAVAKGMRAEWGSTLRKLRHWPKHADHMHVRLTCPPNSTKCKPFAALPAGDGCGPLLGAKNTSAAFIRMSGELDETEATEIPGDPNDGGC